MSAELGIGPPICARTEFECDCNCGCPRVGPAGDPIFECGWPDCGCGCAADCTGCRLAQEAAG